MTIDKRALREVAEKATKGPWKVFSDIDTKTFSIHTPRDKRCENVIKWGGFDCQPNAEANAEFIAAFNPKVALALLDELETKEEQRANWFRMAQKLGEDLDTAERLIAELDQRLIEYAGIATREARRVAELEARKVNLSKLSVVEVMHMSGFSRDYAEGWCAGNDNAIHEIRTAGVKVKGE
ncbi:ead/Ea22-like family protein [Salmonella enterica subsp. enterica serovar Newport]